MWPFNFEGDELYLNLIKEKLCFIESNSILWYIMANFPTINNVWHDGNAKQRNFLEFSIATPLMKAKFTYQCDLANVV